MTTSLVSHTVKNPPAMQETRVWDLDQGDHLEKGMSTHSSILAWRIPRTVEPGMLQSMGSQRVGHDLTIKPPKRLCRIIIPTNSSIYWYPTSRPQICTSCWESQFLGRLIRSLGSPRRRERSGNSWSRDRGLEFSRRRKGQTFFFF